MSESVFKINIIVNCSLIKISNCRLHSFHPIPPKSVTCVTGGGKSSYLSFPLKINPGFGAQTWPVPNQYRFRGRPMYVDKDNISNMDTELSVAKVTELFLPASKCRWPRGVPRPTSCSTRANWGRGWTRSSTTSRRRRDGVFRELIVFNLSLK